METWTAIHPSITSILGVWLVVRAPVLDFGVDAQRHHVPPGLDIDFNSPDILPKSCIQPAELSSRHQHGWVLRLAKNRVQGLIQVHVGARTRYDKPAPPLQPSRECRRELLRNKRRTKGKRERGARLCVWRSSQKRRPRATTTTPFTQALGFFTSDMAAAAGINNESR